MNVKSAATKSSSKTSNSSPKKSSAASSPSAKGKKTPPPPIETVSLSPDLQALARLFVHSNKDRYAVYKMARPLTLEEQTKALETVGQLSGLLVLGTSTVARAPSRSSAAGLDAKDDEGPKCSEDGHVAQRENESVAVSETSEDSSIEDGKLPGTGPKTNVSDGLGDSENKDRDVKENGANNKHVQESMTNEHGAKDGQPSSSNEDKSTSSTNMSVEDANSSPARSEEKSSSGGALSNSHNASVQDEEGTAQGVSATVGASVAEQAVTTNNVSTTTGATGDIEAATTDTQSGSTGATDPVTTEDPDQSAALPVATGPPNQATNVSSTEAPSTSATSNQEEDVFMMDADDDLDNKASDSEDASVPKDPKIKGDSSRHSDEEGSTGSHNESSDEEDDGNYGDHKPAARESVPKDPKIKGDSSRRSDEEGSTGSDNESSDEEDDGDRKPAARESVQKDSDNKSNYNESSDDEDDGDCKPAATRETVRAILPNGTLVATKLSRTDSQKYGQIELNADEDRALNKLKRRYGDVDITYGLPRTPSSTKKKTSQKLSSVRGGKKFVRNVLDDVEGFAHSAGLTTKDVLKMMWEDERKNNKRRASGEGSGRKNKRAKKNDDNDEEEEKKSDSA